MTDSKEPESRGAASALENPADGNESDASGNDENGMMQRQDAFVCFTNEKDLRHHEGIRIKASQFTGIAVRVKTISPSSMENLLIAIDMDFQGVQKEKAIADKAAGVKASTVAAIDPFNQLKGIVNLRFEECKFTRKSLNILYEFLRTKQIIETLGLSKVIFEEGVDFKKITEGIQVSAKLCKVTLQNMMFDEEVFGKAIGKTLLDSRTIRELDVSYNTFEHPKCFYDLCSAILNERCRINILKMRGLQITQLEGKIIRYILMKNKQLHTIDLSYAKTDEYENYECFLSKLDQFCNIRYLTMENVKPDLSPVLEVMGQAIGQNTKLEVLILRENKIKWVNYQNFWQLILPNNTLQKLNLHKTELNDRVVEKMVKYLEQQSIILADLDLSKNQITDSGLRNLASSLKINSSLKYLNLSSNKIKEDGLAEMADYLKKNETLLELSLGGNTITNEGVTLLSAFLPHNSTLKHLDMSKNLFGDLGFAQFSQNLRFNNGIEFLDIAKNKDVTDEDSLITLADALMENTTIKTIDLTGIQVRKPFLKNYMEPALHKNITIQQILGKIPGGIINTELELNIQITNEIMPLYQKRVRQSRHSQFNLAQVETDPENHTILNLKDKPNKLIKAAFKLIKNYDIRAVDFTNAGMHDDSIRLLSSYLKENPNLRSVILDCNTFTDDGLQKLTETLRENNKLAHMSIRECPHISNKGLESLCEMISMTNTVLFQVDLDMYQFDQDLALTVLTESALNRDIQEQLKPVKERCYFDEEGRPVDRPDRAMQESRVNNMSKLTNQLDIFQTVRSGNTADSDNKVQAKAIQSGDESDGSAKGKDVEEGAEGDGKGKQERRMTAQGEELGLANLGDSQVPTIQVPTNVDHKALGETSPTQLNATAQMIDTEILEQVRFDEKAQVSDCFQSALKTWRIFKPNVINIVDQHLTDQHVEELCQFLTGKEMVVRLNLRRNKIGNEGAKSLSKFISEGDNTLTHLNVTRNRIGEDGGQSLLNALYLTTRVTDCSISYGNMISDKLGRIFDREIKANKQANATQEAKRKEKKTQALSTFSALSDVASPTKREKMRFYELIDMGNDFMRCAIKTTELQSIIQLSLPDNMLGLEDARMLADMIKKSPKLRVLNLRENQLDADCAELISDALVFNSNLRILDMSKNVLGDYGVQILLGTVIRKQLHKQLLVPQETPLLRDRDARGAKDLVDCSKQIKNQKIHSEIKVLKLEENETTTEIFKQIWLALELDQDISIFVENPVELIHRIEAKKKEEELASREASGLPKDKKPAKLASNKIGVLSESQRNLNGSDEQIESQISEDDEEEELDSEEEERRQHEQLKAERAEEQRLFRLKWRKRFLGCSMKVCCFLDDQEEFDEEERLPSCKQVCCWRFLRSRRRANKFHTAVDSLQAFEKSGYQRFVSFLMVFNYIIFYTITITPFVLIFNNQEPEVQTGVEDGAALEEDFIPAQVPAETCPEGEVCLTQEEIEMAAFNNIMLIANGAMIIYQLLCEVVLIAMQKKMANIACCNAYLIAQVVTGVTARAVILLSAQLIAAFFRSGDAISGTWGTALGFMLIFSQLRAFQIFLAALKLNWNCLLPRIERNYRLSHSTFQFGQAVLYKKLSAEPSNVSKETYKLMDAERKKMMSLSGVDEDEIKKKSKRSSWNCKICRFGSPKYWQMVLNDIPLIVAVPFAYLNDSADFFMIVMTLVMSFLDLFFMLTYLSHDEELSLDANAVYEKVVLRNQLKEEDVDKIQESESEEEKKEDGSQEIISEDEGMDGDQPEDRSSIAGEDTQQADGPLSAAAQALGANVSPIRNRSRGLSNNSGVLSEEFHDGKQETAGNNWVSGGHQEMDQTNTSLNLQEVNFKKTS